jgi:hypothetical protein
MNIRFLKALVIFMGVLIVLGILAVGYGFYLKFAGAGKPVANQPVAPTGNVPTGTSPVEMSVRLGAGESIVDVDYPDGRVALRVAGPDGNERILLIDGSTGELLTTIRIDRAGN